MDSSKIKNLLSISKDIRILYVEDNTDARESMLLMLSNFFSDIVISVNGEDGLEQFNNSTFDLILTDINMPKMNGIEMIKAIRKISKNIPIIILSAADEIKTISKTKKSSIDGLLTKPIDTSQLIDMLLTQINQINQNKI